MYPDGVIRGVRRPWVAVLVSIAALVAACGSGPPLDVASNVDLSRFQGKWYEIARLPRTTQTDCHGTTAFYTLNSDGTLSLVNQCNVGGPTGPLNSVSMSANVPDMAVPAKLTLSVSGFSGDYWILEVGTNYEYAVVGHPSRDYLWILSRTSSLDSSTLQGVIDRARGKQFDVSKLEYTPQPPAGERGSASAPVGSVPPAVKTGCSAARGPAEGVGARGVGGILFGIASLAVARRRSRRARPARLA